jgi:hypothetical protein
MIDYFFIELFNRVSCVCQTARRKPDSLIKHSSRTTEQHFVLTTDSMHNTMTHGSSSSGGSTMERTQTHTLMTEQKVALSGKIHNKTGIRS